MITAIILDIEIFDILNKGVPSYSLGSEYSESESKYIKRNSELKG
jgi:hypothetical protein